ncbi:unnamed protein product [Bursaphelenchus xylophilus]|uniref:UDP-glucose 6-dehydrogenase n=1 Tax=Bursaphelenchus xylophilus TaxID=6326 RepID=A0A1I7RLR0_BURXY|nr:unnamed protein product [Bursaphelenchus xylophilus]CAG9082679.1 unnamed protein product [Bursaphelenchus xylophilus]
MVFEKKVERIACVGAGYVGGPTCAMIAFKCPHINVTVVDENEAKIEAWNSEKLPIFEPGLDEIVKATRGRNLFFSADQPTAIRNADLIFITVNTPTKAYGRGNGMAPDLIHVESVARLIAEHAEGETIVVEKSTVPVKAAEGIEYLLRGPKDKESVLFQVLSNPEFMAEGTAIKYLASPDRVLIGGEKSREGEAAVQRLVEVYRNWVPLENIITVNTWSAELTKLAANAFLAQRISSINSISAICEATGAEINQVAHAIGQDSRIGSQFLQASVGFGSSSFKKDILALVYLCESLNLPECGNYWKSVVEMNEWQRERFSDKIIQALFGTVAEKKVTLYGFAHKKNTGDTRESSAISVARHLMEEQARICVFDPKVTEDQMRRDLMMAGNKEMVDKVQYSTCPYKAAEDSHAIVILTEWDEFKTYDYERLFKSMKKPASVFDGRLILDQDRLRGIGFRVFTIGSMSMDS